MFMTLRGYCFENRQKMTVVGCRTVSSLLEGHQRGFLRCHDGNLMKHGLSFLPNIIREPQCVCFHPPQYNLGKMHKVLTEERE